MHVGSTFTEPSAKKITRSFWITTYTPAARGWPSASPTTSSAGRTESAYDFVSPASSPCASPMRTIITPK